MREIKFRAWNGSEMIANWFIVTKRPEQSIGDITLPPYMQPSLNMTNPLAIMQCAGLKDKNGVEIYEGDIIELEADSNKIYWNVPHNLQYGDRCVVEWSNVNLAYYLIPLNEEREEQQMDYFGAWSGWNWIKVIGNIYQNPELLEKNHD